MSTFLLGSGNCKRFDSEGNAYTQAPSWFCYGVVVLCVLSTISQLKDLPNSPNLTHSLSIVALDATSIAILLHHCNTCNAWRGWFLTVAVSLIGRAVLEVLK